MKKLLSLLVVVACFTTAASAQKKLTQGKVVYQIEWDTPEMNDEMKAMLPKECAMYFKNKMSRMEMTMGMMGDNVAISDGNKGETVTYMNMMGNKIGMKMTKADIEKQRGEDKPRVTKTSETKIIAGYTCNKAVIESKGHKFDVWYTRDILASNSANNSYEGIDGFMMQFTIDQKGMLMTMTCKSVEEQSIGDDMFKALEGYEIMTADEMKKKFQQQGGGN